MLARSSLAVAVVAFAVVSGCRPAPEDDTASRGTLPTPTVAPPAPAAVAPPPDLSLEPGLELRRPIQVGRVAVAPIVQTAAARADARPYLTLADGMRNGQVTVSMSSRESLDLSVHNKSARPLFVMHGELVLDGPQDRVMGASLVLEPGETRIVPARCVEQERSEGGSRYTPTGHLAYVTLRSDARHGTQQSVWSRVDETNAALGLHPATRSYRSAAARLDATAEKQRDAVLAAIAALPDHARVVGAAVSLDGKVVAIDRFQTPALWSQLAPMLVSSYVAAGALDGDRPVTTVEGRPTSRTVTPDDVRALASVEGATETTAASTITLAPVDPLAEPRRRDVDQELLSD